MKRALLRFFALYVAVSLFLLFDIHVQGPATLRNYIQRGALVGIGGVFVYLFSTRFGGGYVEDAGVSPDEDAENRRASRRGWLYTSLMVALVLLFTAGVAGFFIYR